MTEIHVLDHKVQLLQPEKGGFRTSLDSVLVAAACPAKAGDSVLDAGCGVGGAAFCLLWRVPHINLTGVDAQADMVTLAQKNAALNKRDAHFITADIRDFAGTQERAFNHVLCNPPYLDAGTYTQSPNAQKAPAMGHAGTDVTLEDWVLCAHRVLKSNGTFTLIHRAEYLDKILQALGRKFGATEIYLFYSYAGEAANRVIVRTIKDRKSPLVIHAPIILHQQNGAYTQEADALLKDGAALT